MTPEDQIHKILKDNGLIMGYQLDFPQYKIWPDEVLLALKILNNYGMKVLVGIEKKKALAK